MPPNRVVVTLDNFDSVVRDLTKAQVLSFDTETTGLRPHQGDQLFSCIFACDNLSAYFNFQPYPSQTPLPRQLIKSLSPIFESGVIFMHNAKFDWHMISKEGVKIKAQVWDTITGARVERNTHRSYSLANCAARIGGKKDATVEECIKKNKLWKWVVTPGKKTRKKNKFYDQVPYDIIVPYGFTDAESTLKLGKHQIKVFKQITLSSPTNSRGSLIQVMDNEIRVTRVCKEMEDIGIKVDLDYCERAIAPEDRICKIKEAEFLELTGIPFKNSGKVLAQAFTALGYPYIKTDKGNPCFNDKALESLDSPIAGIIKSWRRASIRANTYFRSYGYYADSKHIIHASMKQAGTSTGRFSYADPNLQNIPKRGEDKVGFPVRGAFIPRDDFCFVAIDYDQMEFRLMLEYAKQYDLIDKIKAGLDPHQATADLVNIPRGAAKTLNFALLYGMGVAKLAQALKCTEEEAKDFKYAYFKGLPRVNNFIRISKNVAMARDYVHDWTGRRFYFPDPEHGYKAANAIIQGGCASAIKRAMVGCAKILEPCASRMVLQIHDELLFEIHKKELGVVGMLREEMEKAFPYREIPLTCSVEHSWESFGDLVKGEPIDQSVA